MAELVRIERGKITIPLPTKFNLPIELDLRPKGIGYTMRGWDFSRFQVEEAIRNQRMLNPAMELGSNVCPWNCSFCFTEHPDNPSKRRLKNELSLAKRLSLIDEAAELGTRSINFVGAGEPTIDPNFWGIVERMVSKNITPIIYTEGTLRLLNVDFTRKLYDSGATVVLKVNSLRNHEYQNSIVRGNGKNVNADSYTTKRNKVIELLIKEGFADSEPTRLAFDTIITKQNIDEVADIHRYARRNNIFVLFVNYLPSGRSSDGASDALSRDEQFKVFEDFAKIDLEEFGLSHSTKFPYAGGIPCTIRGTGLFVKITGKVHDCPGVLIALGDYRKESLSEIWKRARSITQSFDGGCAPRDQFWKTHEKQNYKFYQITQRILAEQQVKEQFSNIK
ncbi:MAG TPA: radical SAM protein [Pyrinomonadaceae bacterium]|jgi:MoaA/NifB/PqqE/SkfB family radical SAM enzyme